MSYCHTCEHWDIMYRGIDEYDRATDYGACHFNSLDSGHFYITLKQAGPHQIDSSGDRVLVTPDNFGCCNYKKEEGNAAA